MSFPDHRSDGHADEVSGTARRRYPWRIATVAIAVLTAGSIGLTPGQSQSQEAAPTTAASDGSDIVARVGGRDVNISEVRAFLAGLGAEQQAALAGDAALLGQTVRLMLADQLVLDQAREKNWQDNPAVMAQLERLRDSTIVETYLQSVSVPPESYPAEADIQAAYDANKTAFVVPRQFRIAQIFVALATGAEEATESQARSKLADIQLKLNQADADFAAIAQASSDDKDTAGRGGEIGWVAENQIRPEITEQVMGLSNDAIGEPIKLDDGWHIVKLLDTKPSATLSLAEVRPLLIERLRAQRAQILRQDYLVTLLEQSPPAINELALAKIFAAPSAEAPVR